MKKARIIELSEDEMITLAQYQDYHTHALNSSVWYATHYMRTEHQLRDKLYRKGYPRGQVVVQGANDTVSHDIVAEVMDHLRRCSLLKDEEYAEAHARQRLRSGKGAAITKGELLMRGVASAIAESVIEKVYGESNSQDALRLLVEKLYRQELKRSQTFYQMRHRIMRKAAARGWSFGDVEEVMRELIIDE